MAFKLYPVPSIINTTHILPYHYFQADLKTSVTLPTQVLCNQDIWPPICLPPYKPTELPVLYCVTLYFFPFLFSLPFFQHPSSLLRSERQRKPPTVPKWRPLLVNPLCRKQLCIPPPKYFSFKQWHASVSMSHHKMQVDLEPRLTQDMHTCNYMCGPQTCRNTDNFHLLDTHTNTFLE